MTFSIVPEALTAFAAGSESLAGKFGQLADLLEQARVDDQCFGPIGDAVGLSSGYFSSLDECRQLANDAKGFLEQTGEQLRGSFEIYRGVDDGISQAQVLTELIIGPIVQWLAALAASWITAGGSVAAAGATTTVQVGSTGVRITMRVSELQMELFKIVKRLEDLLTRLRGPLRQVIQRMNGLRGGNMAQQFAGRHLGSNPLVNIVTRADDVSLASTTGNRFMQGVTGEGAPAGNIAQTVLTGMLGGQTRVTGAAFSAGVDAAVDGAIKFGTQEAYDQARNAPSEEERRETRERGFTW